MRLTAWALSAGEPKAVTRKYPSPLGAYPDPGAPTTWASARTLSKKSQDDRPAVCVTE